MTFVPLLPPAEEVQAVLPLTQLDTESSAPARQSHASADPTGHVNASSDAASEVFEEASTPLSEPLILEEHSEDTNTVLNPLFHSHSVTSTPALSAASDTDTESEANCLSSSPPSPREMDLASYMRKTDECMESLRQGEDLTINSYFAMYEGNPGEGDLTTPPSSGVPPQGCSSRISAIVSDDIHAMSGPGSTPPLSQLFPVGTSCVSSDPSAFIALTLPPRYNKMKLEAIPSPSLIPPSPFLLTPPGSVAVSPVDERSTVSTIPQLPGGGIVNGLPASVAAKRSLIFNGGFDSRPRSRSLLALSSVPSPGPLTSSPGSNGSSELTTPDTPELTIERMRPGGGEHERTQKLGPSLGRKAAAS